MLIFHIFLKLTTIYRIYRLEILSLNIIILHTRHHFCVRLDSCKVFWKKIYICILYPNSQLEGVSLKIKRNTCHYSNDGKYDVWFCFDPVYFKSEV